VDFTCRRVFASDVELRGQLQLLGQLEHEGVVDGVVGPVVLLVEGVVRDVFNPRLNCFLNWNEKLNFFTFATFLKKADRMSLLRNKSSAGQSKQNPKNGAIQIIGEILVQSRTRGPPRVSLRPTFLSKNVSYEDFY